MLSPTAVPSGTTDGNGGFRDLNPTAGLAVLALHGGISGPRRRQGGQRV